MKQKKKMIYSLLILGLAPILGYNSVALAYDATTGTNVDTPSEFEDGEYNRDTSVEMGIDQGNVDDDEEEAFENDKNETVQVIERRGVIDREALEEENQDNELDANDDLDNGDLGTDLDN